MPTTPIYALRYPAPTDAADGPVGFQNLAEDVEGKIGAAVPSTTFPASPTNGQLHRYPVTANGPVWTFVYLSASSAPRWHFLGGPMLRCDINVKAIAVTATSFVDIPSGTWTLTAPLAGDYDVTWTLSAEHTQAAGSGLIGIKNGAAATADNDAVLAQAAGAGGRMGATACKRFTFTAGAVVKAQCKVLTGQMTINPNSGGFVSADSWFGLVPARVS